VTESQSRILALEDSANVSRRSEERPLISANEVLRFPLDDVLVLPEGQYPIRARHIRYYEDRHFAPIDRARAGKALPAIIRSAASVAQQPAASLSGFRASLDPADLATTLDKATKGFQRIAEAAGTQRRMPIRV